MTVTTYVYLAAAWDRAFQMQQAREVLQGFGFESTSRWIDQAVASGVPIAGDTGVGDIKKAAVAAQQDMSDLLAADIVIVYTRSKSTTGGRHVELGMALVAGKKIIIIGPRENIFQAMPKIEQFTSFAKYIEHLRVYRAP